MSRAIGRWKDHRGAVVYAHDASWGGWGRAVCTEDGPLLTAWAKCGGGWEWAKLAVELEEACALELVEARAARTAGSPPVLVAAEKVPAVYRGRGNQANTGWGVGRIVGPILTWAAAQEGLAYPMTVEPKTWRRGMGIGGRGRAAKKRAAVRHVRAFWSAALEGHGDDPDARLGDVAEAVLIGVFMARHPELWENGPARPVRSTCAL